jgi:hypothetical protein
MIENVLYLRETRKPFSGEQKVCLEQGSIATVPKNQKHVFSNQSERQAIMH